MENNSKLQIYKGIINYLIEVTNYNLKNIAELSNTSLKDLITIYSNHQLPENYAYESGLINLYRLIIDLERKKPGLMKIDFEKSYSSARGVC